MNFFDNSSTRIVECVSEYIFLISKKKKKPQTNKKTKAKAIMEDRRKRISAENLTG